MYLGVSNRLGEVLQVSTENLVFDACVCMHDALGKGAHSSKGLEAKPAEQRLGSL